jgi:hypothetical protein
MSMQKRLVVSLAVSVCLAILLLVSGNRSQSELFFYAQWPGIITIASIFGTHGGGNPIVEEGIWAGVNALAYWPLVFAQRFLIKRKPAG